MKTQDNITSKLENIKLAIDKIKKDFPPSTPTSEQPTSRSQTTMQATAQTHIRSINNKNWASSDSRPDPTLLEMGNGYSSICKTIESKDSKVLHKYRKLKLAHRACCVELEERRKENLFLRQKVKQ